MTLVLPLRTRRVRRRRGPVVAPSGSDAVPRVARMLALAHHRRGLIRSGVVKGQAALAALVGVTRARVPQVMDLLYLAPVIQEEIHFLAKVGHEGGAVLHLPLTRIASEPLWDAQRATWATLRARTLAIGACRERRRRSAPVCSTLERRHLHVPHHHDHPPTCP